ncbi:hypothetical protein VTO73DRAFT_1461 [Trametes versicolor]
MWTHRRPSFLDTQRLSSPPVLPLSRATGAAERARTNSALTAHTLYNNKNDWTEFYRRRQAGSASAVDAAHDLHDSSHLLSSHCIASQYSAHNTRPRTTRIFWQDEWIFRMDYPRTI